MAKKKKFIVVDSSNNEVECYTVRKAAKILDMTVPELKLVMFKRKRLPYYRLMGRAKKRKILRITAADLKEFTKTEDFFDCIADRIKQARLEHPMTRFNMTQTELGKECKLTYEMINKIERKKERIGLKALERIANALGRKLEWFLE